jgi:hypothetical protein
MPSKTSKPKAAQALRIIPKNALISLSIVR